MVSTYRISDSIDGSPAGRDLAANLPRALSAWRRRYLLRGDNDCIMPMFRSVPPQQSDNTSCGVQAYASVEHYAFRGALPHRDVFGAGAGVEQHCVALALRFAALDRLFVGGPRWPGQLPAQPAHLAAQFPLVSGDVIPQDRTWLALQRGGRWVNVCGH